VARLLIICLVLLLAGCAAGEPAANTAAAQYDRRDNAIEVTVSDLQPVSSAFLVGPTGTRYAATGVNLLRGPYTAYNPPSSASVGVGGFGGGFGSAVGLSFPVGGPTVAASSNQFVSSALIPLPADYVLNWHDYRVEVQLGNRVVNVPAPQPTGS
jgi:hypothetical protein